MYYIHLGCRFFFINLSHIINSYKISETIPSFGILNAKWHTSVLLFFTPLQL